MTSHERVDWQLEEPTSQFPWFFAANPLVRAILAPSRVFRNSYEKSKEIVAKSCRKGFAQRIELLARKNLENGPEIDQNPRKSRRKSRLGVARAPSTVDFCRSKQPGRAASRSGRSSWYDWLIGLVDLAGTAGLSIPARPQARTSSAQRPQASYGNFDIDNN